MPLCCGIMKMIRETDRPMYSPWRFTGNDIL